MPERVMFLRRVTLAGGVAHTTFTGLRGAIKKSEEETQKPIDQRSPGQDHLNNIPITACNRNDVEECEN